MYLPQKIQWLNINTEIFVLFLWRAIVMHAAARRTLMLQQLREGLQLYRLIDTMEKNREVCRSLFVMQGGNDKVKW